MNITNKYFLLNSLSIARVFLLIPAFILCFSDYSFYNIFIIFIAMISDYLDGFIARKYNLTTNLGAIIDHTSDKVFTVGILLAIAITSYSIAVQIMIIILCLREIIALSLRLIAIEIKKEIKESNIIGKSKTAVLFFYLISYFLWDQYIFNFILLLLCVILSLLSLGIYLIKLFSVENDR